MNHVPKARRLGIVAALAASLVVTLTVTVTGCDSSSGPAGNPATGVTRAQVLHGRTLVLAGGCSDCHNRGKDDPNDPHWLAGYIAAAGTGGSFDIGPFKTYAANLTSDKTNGIGMHTARQIFNALRYGLDPMDTPSVTITSTTPGSGNFPAAPHYLAPPMPWPAIRHSSDDDLWAIIAYLQHGTKADANAVPDSQGPPDFWASSYTVAAIGPYPAPAFPAGNEVYAP